MNWVVRRLDGVKGQPGRRSDLLYCYGARTSGRSPWGEDTARRQFIGGGRTNVASVISPLESLNHDESMGHIIAMRR